MKKDGLRRWEGALMAGFAIALLLPLIGGKAQGELAGKVIRLHVLAHSDAPQDQALKLAVRDGVLAYLEPVLSGGASREQAEALLVSHLEGIQNEAQDTVTQAGYDYPVSVSLAENVPFPTKDYGSFSLPAGGYTALRVVIGAGGGQNWWCVVFPPLCMAAAADPLTQAAAVGSLDGEDVALITESSPEYVLKFKAAEWWQSLRDWWAGR